MPDILPPRPARQVLGTEHDDLNSHRRTRRPTKQIQETLIENFKLTNLMKLKSEYTQTTLHLTDDPSDPANGRSCPVDFWHVAATIFEGMQALKKQRRAGT